MAALGDGAAIDLLVGALERPSPSGGEAEVASFLRDAMSGFAPDATIDAAGNATASVGGGGRRVVLLGHIDTVDGFWPVRHEEGIVHGRGAVDAKGPFCAMVAAVSRLSERAREALTVVLIGAVEEEAPSSRGARHALGAYASPDLVVVGEPSGWDTVTLGYKGRLALRLVARRARAHSAREEPTAAESLVEAWQALHAWAAARSAGAAGAFETVQAALVALGGEGDGLHVTSHADVVLRLPPGCPPEEVGAELERVVASLGAGAGLRLELGSGERAYQGPRDTPLTRAFRTAIRRHGGTPRLTLKTGTSDMNVVAPVWDVPMLAYGPGDPALDHAPDERVETEEYLRAISVLTDAIEALAG